MKEHILIVDDNNDILELLKHHLNTAGYDVLGLLCTKHLRRVLIEEDIDLIIMDRKLPNIDGSYYVEMLRSMNINTPVIFLSAMNSTEEIKEGFLRGGDDYLTKPFDLEELLLRVKAVLRRTQGDVKELIENVEHRDMKLDLNMHKVQICELDIMLTNIETSLLQILITNKGKILDREFLLKYIWKDANIHPRTINVAISRLKKKIDPTNSKEYIKTINGVGYLMV